MLASGGACFAWAFMPRWARAAGGRDMRLVTIVLRGALDGLSSVAPVGDPDYADLHGALALSLAGDHPALPLDGFFALNPAMPNFARLFKAGQGAVVHAVATGYRERSHFDGQDVLESGYPAPGRTDSGWLNRALMALPQGERIATGGLAVGTVSPLVIRGGAPRAATLKSHGDHRIAMAAAVALHALDAESSVRGWSAVASSYPGFAADLDALTGRG